MLPCRREHQFRGPRPPKSIQNPLKNDAKNRSGKITMFYRLLLPFYSIWASNKPLKNDAKIDVKKHLKKHLKKRHLETWPTKEREARFILRSLATKISKRKRHDTTQLDTTRTLVNTQLPGVLPGRCSKNASKYACSWGRPREDSRNAINSQYACSGLQER